MINIGFQYPFLGFKLKLMNPQWDIQENQVEFPRNNTLPCMHSERQVPNIILLLPRNPSATYVT